MDLIEQIMENWFFSPRYLEAILTAMQFLEYIPLDEFYVLDCRQS